jgi:hypothetical protein
MIAGSFPDLVAKVSLTEIVWSEETKSKWTEIFNSQAPSPFWKTSKGFVSAKELLDTPAYKQLMRDF